MFEKIIDCEVFKKTSMMKFILVKLQAYSLQSANQQQTDFTADSFWNIFQKLAVLNSIFWQKSLWSLQCIAHNFTENGVHARPSWRSAENYDASTENFLGGSFFSVKLLVQSLCMQS